MYLNGKISVLGGTIDSRATTGRSAYTKITDYSTKSKDLELVRKLKVIRNIMHKGEHIEVNMEFYVETIMSE